MLSPTVQYHPNHPRMVNFLQIELFKSSGEIVFISQTIYIAEKPNIFFPILCSPTPLPINDIYLKSFLILSTFDDKCIRGFRYKMP